MDHLSKRALFALSAEDHIDLCVTFEVHRLILAMLAVSAVLVFVTQHAFRARGALGDFIFRQALHD